MVPENLKKLFKKIFTLKFEEEPPYKELRDKLVAEYQREVEQIQEVNPSYIHQFEWISEALLNISRAKRQISKKDYDYLESLSKQSLLRADIQSKYLGSFVKNDFKSILSMNQIRS